MKYATVAAFALLAVTGLQPAAAASPDDFVGKWKWSDFVIEIAKCSDNPSGAPICGKVISGPKNVGMEMFRSKFEQKGDEFFGKTAHPMTGDIYNSRSKLSGDTLVTDGCTDNNVCAKAEFARVK